MRYGSICLVYMSLLSSIVEHASNYDFVNNALFLKLVQRNEGRVFFAEGNNWSI